MKWTDSDAYGHRYEVELEFGDEDAYGRWDMLP